MSDSCLTGLTRRFCAFRGCNKKLYRYNKSGYCRIHQRNHGEKVAGEVGGAWTVVRPDLRKQWDGENQK